MPPDDRRPSRRSYLRLVGSASLVGLAGCSSSDGGDPTTDRTPSETQEPVSRTERTTSQRTSERTTESTAGVDEDRFESVVDVSDAGADTSGDTPINPILEENVGDDTLLYFPPGEYRLAEWSLTGYRNLGIVGDDAILHPPEEEQDYWLTWGNLEDLLFEGFTIDSRPQGVAPVNHLAVTGGSNVVRNVTVRGYREVPRSAFEVAAESPETELLLDQIRLPDGGVGGSGIYTFPKSVGTLVVRDCHVAHWGEGLYASPHSGPLTVTGGYYANNGIAQVRVGGGPNGAVIEDVTVRVDDPTDPGQKQNMRGIWMEEGEEVRISNCDVEIVDLTGTYSSGGIVVGRQFGKADVRDTRIRVDAGNETPAVNLRTPIESLEGQTMPSMDRLPEEWTVTCSGVEISGAVPRGKAIRLVERDDCLFEQLCINQPAGNRTGIGITRSSGCTLRDSTIDVSGTPVTTDDASVTTDGLVTSGECGKG